VVEQFCRFPTLHPPRYDGGMSGKYDKVTIIEWVREVLPPITYALLVAAPFVLFYGGAPVIFWGFAGGLYGACVIRAIVLWINRRDDPRSTKMPPDAP
jgi:hypothetical protein